MMMMMMIMSFLFLFLFVIFEIHTPREKRWSVCPDRLGREVRKPLDPDFSQTWMSHNNLPCINVLRKPQNCCGPCVWNPLNINKYGVFLSGKHPAFLQVDTPDPDDSAELRRELVLAPLHELDWNWLMSMTGRFCNFTLDTLDIQRWVQMNLLELHTRDGWILEDCQRFARDRVTFKEAKNRNQFHDRYARLEKSGSFEDPMS